MLIIFFYLILHKPIVEPNIILIFDYRKTNDKTIFKRYREVYSDIGISQICLYSDLLI